MMITLEKIHLYKKYSGDMDGWARMGSAQEKSVMSDADWYEINSIVQEYGLVKAGLASVRYAARINDRIVAAVSDEATAEELRQIVSQYA